MERHARAGASRVSIMGLHGRRVAGPARPIDGARRGWAVGGPGGRGGGQRRANGAPPGARPSGGIPGREARGTRRARNKGTDGRAGAAVGAELDAPYGPGAAGAHEPRFRPPVHTHGGPARLQSFFRA